MIVMTLYIVRYYLEYYGEYKKIHAQIYILTRETKTVNMK